MSQEKEKDNPRIEHRNQRQPHSFKIETIEDIRRLPDAERRRILTDWKFSDINLQHNRAIDLRDQLPQPNEVFMKTLPGAQYHQTSLTFNGKILSKYYCRIILQHKHWKRCLKRLEGKSENAMKVQTAIHRVNQENSNILNDVRTRNFENIDVDQLHQMKVPILHKVADVVLEACTEGIADLSNQKLSRETQLVLLEFQLLANSIQTNYRRTNPGFETPSATDGNMKIICQLQNLGNNTHWKHLPSIVKTQKPYRQQL
ncbi:MAG: hypothetical protein EZS28_004537 [Streblomastix strix]|uniref:Uncharacterized protein n=1 Tax=Streblomastix strix TaxID=222440 RepID=A0A5J4WZG9_9EUKA|nr:MAG: hypothetical protein EZS28_004537 [Streblomastix strix]